jgi:hypothetical protein
VTRAAAEHAEIDRLRRRALGLLSVDGGAGLAVGLMLLSLRPWVAPFFGMPLGWVTAIGLANLIYGSYSATLAWRAWRGVWPPRVAIDVLATANAAWTVVCAGLLVSFHAQFGFFGLAHITLEGAFVGALAVAEWRWVRPLVS